MVDFSYIKDIAGGDEGVFKSLLSLIFKNLGEYPGQIKSLYDKGEMHAMRELVHKYKSSTAYLHFAPLNEILHKLEYPSEHNLQAGDYPELLGKVFSLSEYLKQEVGGKL